MQLIAKIFIFDTTTRLLVWMNKQLISHPKILSIVLRTPGWAIKWSLLTIPKGLNRAPSHTSQEPWPWIYESPKESVQRPSQDTPKIMSCGHGSSSVVWSHMRRGPQPNAISMKFYSCGSSHLIKIKIINGCERLECHDVPVLWYGYFQEVVFENNPSDHET